MSGPIDYPLGAPVVIVATVVGTSRFERGKPTFLVEFSQKGHSVQQWFHADDLQPDGEFTPDLGARPAGVSGECSILQFQKKEAA